MRVRQAVLVLISLASLTAVAALPGAATARPKKVEPEFVFTFHGTFSTDESEIIAWGTPADCKGQVTETLHLSMSTQAVVVTSRRPLGKEGRYYYSIFNAPLRGFAGTDSAATAGHWEPDPAEPFGDPSHCVFTPGQAEANCTVAAWETEEGPEFLLQSVPQEGGRLYIVRAGHWFPTCEGGVGLAPGEPFKVGLPEGDLFNEALATKLRVAKVLALAKGHSVSDSGSVTLPRPPGREAGMIPGSNQGTETNSYQLTIKRVR
jgi:hypothetical protein